MSLLKKALSLPAWWFWKHCCISPFRAHHLLALLLPCPKERLRDMLKGIKTKRRISHRGDPQGGLLNGILQATAKVEQCPDTQGRECVRRAKARHWCQEGREQSWRKQRCPYWPGAESCLVHAFFLTMYFYWLYNWEYYFYQVLENAEFCFTS